MPDVHHNPPNEKKPGNAGQALAVCLFLLLAVAIVFGRTVEHDFINLDDDMGVSENPWVHEGLTADSIRWAFTSRHLGNWDPITWISHIIDWRLYGDNAGGHHLTNVLLHAAAAVLLFLALRAMTGRLWPSALAAALFAVHPLQVESVAWVTARKDVLSGFFFMLALLAYAAYARCERFSLGRYLAVIVLFALGLMSKPMLVTLPCVLLLLDYWPLRRFARLRSLGDDPPPLWRPIVEKIPLFLLAIACCIVTVWAQQVPEHEYGPWRSRVGNAAISYADYLVRYFHPVDLAPLAPRTAFDLPLGRVVGAFSILLLISGAVLLRPRKRPYPLVGWLWFAGMLFPVIGLVPFGTQAAADRFTYLPQIGLGIVLAWGAAELCDTWPKLRRVCAAASIAAIVALIAVAARQTAYWRDSETLWNRTLACTANNYMAHNSLGNALAARGKYTEAADQYRKAIELLPEFASAHYNLGLTQARRGRLDEAVAHYRNAVRLNNNHARAHNNLADALLTIGLVDEAIEHARTAIRIAPDYPEYHFTLGNVWLIAEQYNGAVVEYQKALAAGSANAAECHVRLALAHLRLGQRERAAEHYREALRIQPNVLDDRPQLEAHFSEKL